MEQQTNATRLRYAGLPTMPDAHIEKVKEIFYANQRKTNKRIVQEINKAGVPFPTVRFKPGGAGNGWSTARLSGFLDHFALKRSERAATILKRRSVREGNYKKKRERRRAWLKSQQPQAYSNGREDPATVTADTLEEPEETPAWIIARLCEVEMVMDMPSNSMRKYSLIKKILADDPEPVQGESK